METELADIELEGAVLSCVLLSEAFLPRLLDEGLKAQHFYFDEERRCYESMVKLFDEGSTIDRLTVAMDSGVKQDFVDLLAAAAPGAGGARTYARKLIELWERRRVVDAGNMLIAAGRSNDKELREEAEGLLAAQVEAASHTFTPDQLATRFWERLERGRAKSIPFPMSRLSDLVGGMRPGEVTLIGGWTSHGKSVWLDDVLFRASESGASTHLFINEMTADERVDRLVSKATGIPSLLVAEKERLTQSQLEAVINAIGKLPFGITEAAGWTAQDIRREIRRRQYDVVGVDILHLIEYREERDLASISRTLNVAAKESGCHILATVHLKDERLKNAIPPAPTLSDIKGAGALKQDADNVMFVYRECDEIGSPGTDAKIWFAKARQGQTGGVKVVFDGGHMRFIEHGWEPF